MHQPQKMPPYQAAKTGQKAQLNADLGGIDMSPPKRGGQEQVDLMSPEQQKHMMKLSNTQSNEQIRQLA